MEPEPAQLKSASPELRARSAGALTKVKLLPATWTPPDPPDPADIRVTGPATASGGGTVVVACPVADPEVVGAGGWNIKLDEVIVVGPRSVIPAPDTVTTAGWTRMVPASWRDRPATVTSTVLADKVPWPRLRPWPSTTWPVALSW